MQTRPMNEHHGQCRFNTKTQNDRRASPKENSSKFEKVIHVKYSNVEKFYYDDMIQTQWDGMAPSEY